LIDARREGKLKEIEDDIPSYGWPPGRLRVLAIVGPDAELSSPYLVQVVRDDDETIAKTYFRGEASEFIIRPDGYIAWRGKDWRNSSIFDRSYPK
jgi:hypothetical protein